MTQIEVFHRRQDHSEISKKEIFELPFVKKLITDYTSWIALAPYNCKPENREKAWEFYQQVTWVAITKGAKKPENIFNIPLDNWMMQKLRHSTLKESIEFLLRGRILGTKVGFLIENVKEPKYFIIGWDTIDEFIKTF